MAHWTEIVRQIDRNYPFLSTIQLTSDTNFTPDCLPDLLKISIASASSLVTSPRNRMAMVFPRLDSSPAWIALGTTLVSMRANFEQALADLPPLIPGSKVKIDGKYVALFENETETGYRVRLHSGTIPKRGPLYAWKTIPKAERLRLQATSANHDLSQLANLVKPQKEFIDRLLDIETFGNRSIFKTYVILVSRVGGNSSLLRSSQVVSDVDALINHPPAFSDVLQWGALRMDGKLVDQSIGQIKADPVLLFAPDLMAVREYLRANPKVNPLIILDGGSAIVRREGVLDEVLDAGCCALACVETYEAEQIETLRNSDFRLWTWSRKDLHTLLDAESKRHSFQAGGYFGSLRRSYYNYARRNVTDCLCQDSVLQAGAEYLEDAVRQLRRNSPDSQENIELEGLMYGCLLEPARMLRPFFEERTRLEQKIARLQQEIANRQWWIPEAVTASATKLTHTLCELTERLPDDDNAKVAALREMLLQSKFQSVGVLVGNVGELEATKRYWQPFLSKYDLNVRFFALNTAEEPALCDHLIICGWLNKQRMRRLLDGSLASRISVLLYPFEQAWSRRAVRLWNSTSLAGMSDSEKASLLLPGKAVVIESEPDPIPAVDAHERESLADVVDLTDFELSIREYRRDVLVRMAQSSQEERVRAVYVRFSAGYYAFLTDKHKVPVATDILAGFADQKQEMPRKSPAELRVGDYIVFREGMQGDILREWADRGLKRAGKGNLRAVAGLWKKALRDFAGIVPGRQVTYLNMERFATLVQRLRIAGVQTGEGTIRWWLLGDNTIGPRPLEYLEGIAEATQDTELKTRLPEVREAIKKLYGAHLQAAHYLAERLFAMLPRRLAGVCIETSPRIDLGEDGSIIVVRVEEILEKPVEVGWSKVNYLLEDTSDSLSADEVL